MATYFPTGYTLPGGDQPLTHARMLHARNWLSGGTATASSTDADFFAAAPLNSMTYERWRPGTMGATWAYDHGSVAQIDALCIAAHTLGTSGTTLEVSTSTDNVTFTPLIGPIQPPDNEAIWCVLPLHGARYCRIELSGIARPVLGAIRFGRSLQFPEPMFGGHKRARFARQTVMRTNESETGEFLGQTTQRVSRPTSYQWQHLPRAWTEANWPPLQIAIEREPFWLSWRPGDYGDVGYFKATGVTEAVTMGIRDFYEAGIEVRGYSHD
jgi:hypothetical protein